MPVVENSTRSTDVQNRRDRASLSFTLAGFGVALVLQHARHQSPCRSTGKRGARNVSAVCSVTPGMKRHPVVDQTYDRDDPSSAAGRH